MQRKQYKVTVKQIGPESERTLRFVGSDETIDRDGDIVDVAGWDLDNYMKNPVVLWSHDGYSVPPIGKTVNLNKDLANKQLVFDIKFPTLEEMSTNTASASEHAKFVDTVYNMCKNGYLNAVSVGFQGVKFKTRDDDDVLDLPEWQRGTHYMEQELYEISICSIPANPNALQTAKSKGLIDEKTIKSFFDIPKNKESEVKAMSEKSGARLSDDSKKVLTDIHKSLSDGMKEHKSAHSGTMDAYKAVADKLDGGATWDSVKDDMMKAIDSHDQAHKTAMKCYKACADDLKKFIDPDSGTQQQGGEISDGVERALDELSTQIKSLIGIMQKPNPQTAGQKEIDLDNIQEKDLADIIGKEFEKRLNAATGKI